MKILIMAIGLLVAAASARSVSAQALDAVTGAQAITDLAEEVIHSDSWLVYKPRSCDPLDPDARASALAELNGFDQRAVDLANRISGYQHVKAMSLVRMIEAAYFWVNEWPASQPDYCYVAPGA